MKNLKNGLLALALVAGLTGAFVSKIHAAPKVLDPTFNWQKTDATGNVIIGGQFEAGVTAVQAATDFGCDGGDNDCAITVVSQDGAPTSTPLTLTQSGN